MSNLIEKPIRELLDKQFFIPSYQRGYRWTKQQVTDLLNDIWEFSQKDKKESEWYCLQPIVVLKKEGKYNVLDGQQRLTTIFLILKYLGEKTFSIEYETRTDSEIFLSNMEESKQNDNIDYFHIIQANTTINDWFSKIEISDKENFKNIFLNKTKSIWYETTTSTETEEIEIFTRLNMGKIRLTNSELIKALFLNSSNFDDKTDSEIHLKQLEIANEWDNIEYVLQNDEFWYFITNKEEENYPTRIDYLFEIIKEKEDENSNDNEEYATFRYFSNKFKSNNKNEVEQNWEKIKRTFQTLEEWFLDKELYHKIGYLIATGSKMVTLLKDNSGKSKTEFKADLNIKIAETLKIEFEELAYGNCRFFLLLHNVHTMLQNENSSTRFLFNKYKNEHWDIEHIHAKATEVTINKGNLKQWLKDNSINKNEEDNETYQQIKEILSDEISEDNITDADKEKIISYVLGDIDDDVRNMCLLDRSTNRSYKNDSFKVKRQKLIEFERQGTFVPICTRNVFLKYYSDKLTDMDLWNEEDREKYKENLKEVYNFYKPKN